jgi:hypothetical protein
MTKISQGKVAKNNSCYDGYLDVTFHKDKNISLAEYILTAREGPCAIILAVSRKMSLLLHELQLQTSLYAITDGFNLNFQTIYVLICL